MRHFEDRLSLLFRRQQEKTRSGRNKKKQTPQSALEAHVEDEFGGGGLVGNTAEGASTSMKSQDILRNKNRRCECVHSAAHTAAPDAGIADTDNNARCFVRRFFLKETLAQLQRQEVARMQLIYEHVADDRDALQRIADCPSDRDPAAVK